MASCTKCSATLIASAKFCAACGSPVAAALVVPGPTGPMRASTTPPAPAAPDAPPAAPPNSADPFARTMMGAQPESPSVYGPPPPVSPMAASVMSSQGNQGPPPALQAPLGVPAGYAPTPWNVAPTGMPYGAQAPQTHAPQQQPYAHPYAQPQVPQGAGPFTQLPPAAAAAYGPGALVLVHWADGNRYPATVLQAAGNQLLVAFPGGAQQWIDAHYVSSGV